MTLPAPHFSYIFGWFFFSLFLLTLRAQGKKQNKVYEVHDKLFDAVVGRGQ